jgi:hypothetical protein
MANVFSLLHPAFFKITSNGTEFTLALAAERTLCGRTRLYRNNCSKLFLSFAKPHKEVTKETISRWIRIILSKAGVDTKIDGPHSVRSAAKANVNSVPLDVILKKAGWSREKTFAIFYNKEIVNEVR